MLNVFGIPNIGSSCWLSSLLQLLLSSRHVSLFLSRVDHQDGKRRLTYALQHLPQQTFLVFSLLRQKFADDGQQDSSEGLLFLLDLLHQEHATSWNIDVGLSDMARQLLVYSKQKVSPVHHLFQSVTRWVDTDQKTRYEPVILSFCEYSLLNKDDNVICIRDAIRNALTKRRLALFAPVLLFCVERMEPARLSNVEYELCESFSIHAPNNTLQYECRGIVLHAGAMTHGHYTAIRRDSIGQWMICDDHHVRTIGEMPTHIRQVPRLLLFDLKQGA